MKKILPEIRIEMINKSITVVNKPSGDFLIRAYKFIDHTYKAVDDGKLTKKTLKEALEWAEEFLKEGYDE